MIRFRLGQSWKHEDRTADPHDGVSLEIDGIDLLSGADQEPLLQVVPQIVGGVSTLTFHGERTAQISLSEAGMDLCLIRLPQSDDVEVSVIALGRSAKLLVGPVRVDLLTLAQAAGRCAESLVSDVRERMPELLANGVMGQLGSQARQLARVEEPRRFSLKDPGCWSHSEGPHGIAWGFRLEDSDARLLTWTRKHTAPLPPLLLQGELRSAENRVDRGIPFLWIADACRRATVDREALEIPLGTNGRARPADVFTLGLRFCVAVCARNPALRSNPYVEALSERCRDGLAALQPPRIDAEPSVESPRGARRRASKQLEGPGSLRRLKFTTRWEQETVGNDGDGQLRVTRRGVLVATQHAAFALSRAGRVQLRRVDPGNICVSSEHDCVVSTPGRLVSFWGHEKNARWFRSYEGPPLTGPLYETSYGWVCSLAHRAVASFSKLTGLEQWRVEPSRAQHSHLVVHGDRLLVATDTGSLLGIDAENGATRYRIRTSLPFTLPPVAHGQTVVAILSRGERTALIAANATNGVLQWSRELSLEQPAVPAFLRGRVWVAGHKRGKACLVSLSRSGQTLWERNLPLEGPRLHVLALAHGAVVQDSRGGAAMVSVDGQIDWVLGTGSADLPHSIAPIHERGVLLLSGETVRAVEPQTGRVLAHIKVGPALTALATDRNLNLYMLMENGLLRAMKLGAQLSVL